MNTKENIGCKLVIYIGYNTDLFAKKKNKWKRLNIHVDGTLNKRWNHVVMFTPHA